MFFSIMQRRAAVSAAVVAVLALVAACGSQGAGAGALALPTGSATPSGAGSASATSSPTATSTGAQASEATAQALAAYRAAFAAWAALVAVADPHDYQSPVLAEHMSGQALSTVTGQVFIDINTRGAVSKGVPVLHPTVGQLIPANNPTQVIVNDCVNTSSWLLYTTDGHLLDNIPGGLEKTQSLMVLTNGVWKMNQLYMQEPGTCS
jgi:hypothetical protein